MYIHRLAQSPGSCPRKTRRLLNSGHLFMRCPAEWHCSTDDSGRGTLSLGIKSANFQHKPASLKLKDWNSAACMLRKASVYFS